MSRESSAKSVTDEVEMPCELRDDEHPSKRHEVLGVLLGLIALFWLLSLISYDGLGQDDLPVDGENLVGVAGTWIAFFSIRLLGMSVYLIDVFLWMFAFDLFLGRQKSGRAQGVLGILVAGVLCAILLHTLFLNREILGGHLFGGFLGQLLGEILISLISTTGTYLVAIGGLVIVVLLVTDISLATLTTTSARFIVKMLGNSWHFLVRVVRAWRTNIEEEQIISPPADPPELPVENIEIISPDEEVAVPPKPSKSSKSSKPTKPAKSAKPAESESTEPKIVTKKIPKSSRKKAQQEGEEAGLTLDQSVPHGVFKLPPMSMLAEVPGDSDAVRVDEPYLKSMADRLVKVLSDFNVYGEVKEIHPGPVVTMFEFQPRSGTKLSKIENLSSELAMALEVIKVRVVAPIPGKNAVGFELPNKSRETVFLKEMLLDDGFANKKLKLPLALGKDISGTPYFVDLAKMPHLLIAGTTGSGKSVALNSMLVSLLYKYTPEELRMLLVDPKMIELGTYDGIPHLLLPVVTDMNKACLALKWAVDEMERRYQIFADLGVKNLDSHNRKVTKLLQAAEEKEAEPIDLDPLDPAPVEEKKPEKLPLIIIVIDELADLMMVAAKDVETSIARLAQKARASGIHLIIATQRPSVDVITGLIKANFPSRISFRVSSGHDSRTILGTHGAENLLGQGDMLVLPPGTSDLDRVHGAFIDEDECTDIAAFLKEQGTPTYDEEILKPRDEDGEALFDEEEKDEVYDEAVQIVAEAQTCSISMLQRRLRIGYNRSARIVERMEHEGVVGPANGVNKREVLISAH